MEYSLSGSVLFLANNALNMRVCCRDELSWCVSARCGGRDPVYFSVEKSLAGQGL